MKVSLDGLFSNIKQTMKKTDRNTAAWKYMLDELLNNMKWLKQEGTPEAVKEFFETYVVQDKETK